MDFIFGCLLCMWEIVQDATETQILERILRDVVHSELSGWKKQGPASVGNFSLTFSPIS